MESVLLIVTLASLVLALGMSLLGWRLLRADRRRSAARVEALEADALAMDRFDPLEMATGDPVEARQVSPEDMFGAANESGAPGRRWLAVAAIAIVMVVGAGTLFALQKPAGSRDIHQAAAGAKPLELLSLKHAVDTDGSFAVTGLVQNPVDGRPLRGVIAVVYLFDRDGNYFASGRSRIEPASLQPGEDSPFVVRVPSNAGISRYRITFRGDDGVLPHRDKRTPN